MGRRKRSPVRRRQSRTSNWLWDYASYSMQVLTYLSESNQASKKLQALNLLLSIILGSLFVTHLFVPQVAMFSIDFLIFLAFSLLICFAAGAFYAHLLNVLTNLLSNNIVPLRLSVLCLSIAMTFAIAGIGFQTQTVVNIAYGLFVFQLVILLIGSGIDVPRLSMPDFQTNSNGLRGLLGDVGSIASVIQLIAWIVLIILAV